MKKIINILFCIILAVSCFMLGRTVQNRTISAQAAGLPLPKPFQEAVDKAIEASLQQQRTYNANTYMTKTHWIEQAEIVTGIQSNQIEELYEKVK